VDLSALRASLKDCTLRRRVGAHKRADKRCLTRNFSYHRLLLPHRNLAFVSPLTHTYIYTIEYTACIRRARVKVLRRLYGWVIEWFPTRNDQVLIKIVRKKFIHESYSCSLDLNDGSEFLLQLVEISYYRDNRSFMRYSNPLIGITSNRKDIYIYIYMI